MCPDADTTAIAFADTSMMDCSRLVDTDSIYRQITMDRGPVLACIYHKQIPYATVLSFPVQVKDNAVENTSVRKSDAQNNATKIQEKV
jgi:hypothetical protein